MRGMLPLQQLAAHGASENVDPSDSYFSPKGTMVINAPTPTSLTCTTGRKEITGMARGMVLSI